MPATLYLAPPAAGKTTFVLQALQHHSRDLTQTPCLVVSTPLQRQAAQRRLASMGGALGAPILTMNNLGSRLLAAANIPLTRLADPVVVRLLREAIDRAHLQHYAPLRTSPGFAQAVRRLLSELQTNAISPQELAATVAEAGPGDRELATIYGIYDDLLRQHEAGDGPGWIGRVVELLRQREQAPIPFTWLAFDGFAHFTRAEIALIALLARRLPQLVITLPQVYDPAQKQAVSPATRNTIEQLRQTLDITPVPLPQTRPATGSDIEHLAAHLFRIPGPPRRPAPHIHMLAAADMQQEVRSALRWLKMRHLQDGIPLSAMALLARSLDPYRHSIRQIAAEMGLPLHMPGGFPLAENPAVAALLGLLQLPLGDVNDVHNFAIRPLLAAWRSPYFDWQDYLPPADPAPVPLHADALDRLGRWARVTGGLEQWQQAFDLLLDLPDGSDEPDPQDERILALPRGAHAQALWQEFQTFCQVITPPAGKHPLAHFIAWLEELIGPDPASATGQPSAPTRPSLRMIANLQSADPLLQQRDLAALNALKDVLRGMLSAAQLSQQEDIDYPRFLADLLGSVEAASYDLPPTPQNPVLLAADVVQARGLRFQAVAILGLAEDSFPAPVREFGLLAEQQRKDLKLPLTLESEEAAHFYHAITRSDGQILLCRPQLSESGAQWPPSPYWLQIQRLLDVQETSLSHTSPLDPAHAASWPEIMQILATAGVSDPPLPPEQAGAWQRLQHGVAILQQRLHKRPAAHDGDLRHAQNTLRQHYHAGRLWSISQLETYHRCPYNWFSHYALHLEPRPPVAAGLDARQLGAIYHELLKETYAQAPDPTDKDALLDTLRRLAGPYFDAAPQQLGFRPTAWWMHTRRNILDTLENTIAQLHEHSASWRPFAFEQAFGAGGRPPLTIRAQGQSIRLRGVIDRVDSDGGGKARLIDYKKGSISHLNDDSLQKGTLLQLPLYTLAVVQCLGMEQVSEAFYWSVEKAEKSKFTLRSDDHDTLSLAQNLAMQAVQNVQQGHMIPAPPDDGCPSFCPAAEFCWHYRPRRG